jgi:DNA mismatch repair protein MutS2
MTLANQTLTTLEFPKVREKLAQHTSFSASRELALALFPATDTIEVAYRQQRTSEACQFLDSYPEATIGGAHDIRNLVHRASIGGVLEASHMLEISSTLISMRHLRVKLRKLSPETFPTLTDYSESLPELLSIENEIERTIDDDGTVLDSASAELSRLRSELKIASARLQDKLQNIVSSSQFAKVLQEPIVTVRNGRYVVPVKAPHRRSVPGLVHDQSASGATLYIEPMAVVELNNRLREIEVAEQQEVHRILTALSQRIGAFAESITTGVATLALLDLAFACAKYASVLNASAPELSNPSTEPDDPDAPPPLSLLQARHPLLDQKTVVPIDVWMGKEFQLLIITGPNTGGKTVALKTVGLLAMMAQAGLHIPVREPSRLPVFAHIFADIGDEQSIEQSLSTFSSHMTTIIRMLENIEQARAAEEYASNPAPILVLLDEIGAGTDPDEGTALARAIIERFLQRKCLGIVTTHYAELKAFAHNTSGVQNASVEFDSETLAPAYKLTIGLPGRSNALAIAARLGLHTEVVEQARSFMSQETASVENLLEDIHHKRETAEAEMQRARALRKDAQKYRDRLAHEMQEFEDAREEHMRDALREVEEELRDTRAELRRVREQAKRAAQAQQQWQEAEQHTGEVEATEQDLQQVESRVKTIGRKKQKAAAAATVEEAAVPDVLHVGDTVLVRSIGLSGQIVGIDEEDQTADVQVGNFRVNARLSELRRDKRKGDKEETPQYASRGVQMPAMPDVSMTLDMRGWRAADAEEELEKYLNDAYLSGFPEVRLIHGKGSGTLRQVVHGKIRNHPLVKSFASGGQDGGDGVTVAKLVER